MTIFKVSVHRVSESSVPVFSYLFILLACDFQTYWRNMNEWLRISNFWLLGLIPVVLKLFSSTFKLLYSLSKYLTKFLDFFSFSPWVVWRSVLDTKRFYWSCRIVSLVVGQASCLPYSIFRDPRAVCRGRTILTPLPPCLPESQRDLGPVHTNPDKKNIRFQKCPNSCGYDLNELGLASVLPPP